MTTLTSEDVAELLRLHIEHDATWEQLAADEGCDAASLEVAVQQWEPGAKLSIRAGRARISNSPGRLDLDVLREQVEAGLSDEEIAEIHGVTAALVGLRRRERGIRGARAYCGTPRHLRLLPQVEAALRRLARPSTAAEIAEEAGVTGLDSVRRALAVMEEEGLAVCTHRPKSTRGGSRRWAAEGEPAPATPAPRPEPEGAYAYMRGDSGEVMRGCIALQAAIKDRMDAQVTRPSEIPCAACRRPTPIPELRGRPGRLVCTACAAQAPEPEPEPCAEEAPQPIEEDDEMSRATRVEQEQRRQRALELRREGLTQVQIAECLGVSTTTVCSDLRLLEAAGEELPPNHTPPGREPQEDLHGAIRELIAQGLRHGEIVRQTGASRVMVSRVIRDVKGLPPYPSKEGKHLLRAEIEQLRQTLRETEEGAAELLEELERLREQLAARNLEDLAAREHHGATTPAVQREIEELRAQLAAAEEAARRPPEARRAEVERLELEIEALQRQLDANPWRRAWDALTAHNHAQVSLERARERAAEAAAELEDAEAALLPWSALNGAEVTQ